MIVTVNAIYVIAQRSLKKISTGFEPVTSQFTGVMLYQLSYEAIDFIFISFPQFIYDLFSYIINTFKYC